MSESINWNITLAAAWRVHQAYLRPISQPDLIKMDHLLGIERQKKAFLQNVEAFLQGQATNHILLWGARGTGKSSLVKAALNEYHRQRLRVIEVPREALHYLLDITDKVRDLPYRFIIFCDDMAFSEGDASYVALKSTMDGSIEKPPENVLIIATANRRHLMAEKMSDNHASQIINGDLHPSETVEEKLSLSDRFGLSLSFYALSQKAYLQIVDHYCANYLDDQQRHIKANRFAIERGTRSGRVAKQFALQYQLD